MLKESGVDAMQHTVFDAIDANGPGGNHTAETRSDSGSSSHFDFLNATHFLLSTNSFSMANESAADTCLNIPEVILFIADFIDISNASSLSCLSRTNRCTYLTLLHERSQNIDCAVVNIPSLSLFLNGQLGRSSQVMCRSLEVSS